MRNFYRETPDYVMSYDEFEELCREAQSLKNAVNIFTLTDKRSGVKENVVFVMKQIQEGVFNVQQEQTFSNIIYML